MDRILSCPKCQGKMERGRLYTPKAAQPDATHFFDYVNWEAAEEKKFGGLFAYKCADCSYLEFYVESQTRKES